MLGFSTSHNLDLCIGTCFSFYLIFLYCIFFKEMTFRVRYYKTKHDALRETESNKCEIELVHWPLMCSGCIMTKSRKVNTLNVYLLKALLTRRPEKWWAF